MAVPAAPTAADAIALEPGAYPLLDERLIASAGGAVREPQTLARTSPAPILTAAEGIFTPFASVRRADQGGYRIWYNTPVSATQTHLAHATSSDGETWTGVQVLEDPTPIQFGASVIDRGRGFPIPAERFAFGYYGDGDAPGLNDGGVKVAFSPDGFAWTAARSGAVVLPHNHDIASVHADPVRGGYVAFISRFEPGPWGPARRVTYTSRSADLLSWEPERLAFAPDAEDEGETQFYSADAVIARGHLLIAMLRVLRDDLPADPGGPVAGIGYTVLAWSADGVTWTRERTPLIDRAPAPGTWDHAMAWGACQLVEGDETLVYYGGYARGHKVERFTERQLGLIRMRRDRYVAWRAGERPAVMRTPALSLGGRLSLNIAVEAGGSVRVRALDAQGVRESRAITADEVAAPVEWIGGAPAGPVVLEIVLERARIFALDVTPR